MLKQVRYEVIDILLNNYYHVEDNQVKYVVLQHAADVFMSHYKQNLDMHGAWAQTIQFIADVTDTESPTTLGRYIVKGVYGNYRFKKEFTQHVAVWYANKSQRQYYLHRKMYSIDFKLRREMVKDGMPIEYDTKFIDYLIVETDDDDD